MLCWCVWSGPSDMRGRAEGSGGQQDKGVSEWERNLGTQKARCEVPGYAGVRTAMCQSSESRLFFFFFFCSFPGVSLAVGWHLSAGAPPVRSYFGLDTSLSRVGIWGLSSGCLWVVIHGFPGAHEYLFSNLDFGQRWPSTAVPFFPLFLQLPFH